MEEIYRVVGFISVFYKKNILQVLEVRPLVNIGFQKVIFLLVGPIIVRERLKQVAWAFGSDAEAWTWRVEFLGGLRSGFPPAADNLIDFRVSQAQNTVITGILAFEKIAWDTLGIFFGQSWRIFTRHSVQKIPNLIIIGTSRFYFPAELRIQDCERRFPAPLINFAHGVPFLQTPKQQLKIIDTQQSISIISDTPPKKPGSFLLKTRLLDLKSQLPDYRYLPQFRFKEHAPERSTFQNHKFMQYLQTHKFLLDSVSKPAQWIVKNN
jgi:hypothetical protein